MANISYVTAMPALRLMNYILIVCNNLKTRLMQRLPLQMLCKTELHHYITKCPTSVRGTIPDSITKTWSPHHMPLADSIYVTAASWHVLWNWNLGLRINLASPVVVVRIEHESQLSVEKNVHHITEGQANENSTLKAKNDQSITATD